MSQPTSAIESIVELLDSHHHDLGKLLRVADREALALLLLNGAFNDNNAELSAAKSRMADVLGHDDLYQRWYELLERSVSDRDAFCELADDRTEMECIAVDAAYALGIAVGIKLAGAR